MSSELIKIDAPEGLAVEQVNAVKDAFRPKFEAMGGLASRYKSLTDIKLVEPTDEQCAEARELRLEAVKIRTGTAKIHKGLKAEVNKYGRYCDGMKNAQELLGKEWEKNLLAIEKFKENAEKERIDALNKERSSALIDLGVEFIPAGLAQMSDEQWQEELWSRKVAKNEREKAERKAEEDRLRKEKEEAAEKERTRLELEELKAERLERDKKDALERAEREKEENKLKAELAEEKRRAEDLERQRKQKEELERIEAEKEAHAALAEKKKKEDKNHKEEVEEVLISDLMHHGVQSAANAKAIIEAIKAGKINRLSINY